MTKNTIIRSECEKHIYVVKSHLQKTGPFITFIGLASMINETVENNKFYDRYLSLSLLLGASGFAIVNVFSIFAPHTNVLYWSSHPVGEKNVYFIKKFLKVSDIVIPCWGTRTLIASKLHPQIEITKNCIFKSNKNILILGLTQGGDPKNLQRCSIYTELKSWIPFQKIENN